MIAEQVAGGIKVGAATRHAARRFRNRSLGHGRQLNLSAASMQRIWYRFQKSGGSAFTLRYVAGREHDLDPLLLNLIVESSVRQSKSVSEVIAQARARTLPRPFFRSCKNAS